MSDSDPIRRQDLRDPDVPLTRAMVRAMTHEDWTERDRRAEQRLVDLPPGVLERAEATIEDQGLERVVADIAAWVRAVLRDPDTTEEPPILTAPVVELWRTLARNLQGDLTRHALGAGYVRELVRYDTGLRRSFKKPPAGLDDFHTEQLYRGADVTSRQLTTAAGLPWPRPRRRRRPARAPEAPSAAILARQNDPRDRAAYDREQIDRRNRDFDERVRRILDEDDTTP